MAKRYVIVVAGFFFAFLLANVIFWHVISSQKGAFHDGHGDLVMFSGVYLPWEKTLPKDYDVMHKELGEYLKQDVKQPVDVLTIGDSFSNGGSACSYQDYICTKTGLNVVNAPPMLNSEARPIPYGALDWLCILDNYGYIDILQPKVIILESIVRSMPERFDRKELTVLDIPKKTLDDYCLSTGPAMKVTEEKSNTSSSTLINPALVDVNYQKLNMMYKDYKKKKENDNKYDSSQLIALTELDRELFTGEGAEKTLAYSPGDYWYLKNDTNLQQINDRCNELAARLEKKGIKLIILFPVDKFDLYYPYIVDKDGRPENTFFADFAKLPKKYTFIDTKSILRKAVAEGNKDVYWLNDAHWSWVGMEKVLDDMFEKHMLQ